MIVLQNAEAAYLKHLDESFTNMQRDLPGTYSNIRTLLVPAIPSEPFLRAWQQVN